MGMPVESIHVEGCYVQYHSFILIKLKSCNHVRISIKDDRTGTAGDAAVQSIMARQDKVSYSRISAHEAE